MCSASVASREAFIDAIAVVMVGDDEYAAVGQCSGGSENEGAGKEYGSKSHEAPKWGGNQCLTDYAADVNND